MLDIKLLLTVFGTVFLAELGDKTQLATLFFGSREDASRLTVFVGASLALVTTSAIGVLTGAAVSSLVNPRQLSYAAGIGFILIVAWTLWRA